MGESRKDVLMKALEAEVGGGSDDPGSAVYRRCRRVVAIRDRVRADGARGARALSASSPSPNVVISVPRARRSRQQGVRRVGRRSGHTGPLVLDEDAALEATGEHVQLAGVTVADFREGKIRSYRTYFDDLSLIEQLVGA